MKFVYLLLLSAPAFSGTLPDTVADSAKDGAKLVRRSIDLDPTKEYSAEDFKVLFAGQIQEAQEKSPQPVATAHEQVYTATALMQGDSVKYELHQKATFGFFGWCDIADKTTGHFSVNVRYDGRDFLFRSLLNIDRFGPYTSGGGGRYAVFGTAGYQHTACRAMDEETFCSYLYHSTIKVLVTGSGKQRGLEIGTYQPGEGPLDKDGHIIETCVLMSSLPEGKKSPCPRRNKDSTRCKMGNILVAPW